MVAYILFMYMYMHVHACRSQNIRESQQMSIQRNVDLHDLDRFGPRHSPANRRKAEPPLPPGKKKQDEPPVSVMGLCSDAEYYLLSIDHSKFIIQQDDCTYCSLPI